MMQRDLCCRRTYKKQRLGMGDCRLRRCKYCNFTRGSMLEVVCVGGSSSQGLAPWTGELSQTTWTHQGQGLHAAKSKVTAKKTGLDVVTEEAQAAGEADYSVCTTGILNSNSDISDDITMSSAKL
ncbi:hypothetical protein ACQJBY_035432 [Aegilops geniculata]